jgi:threonine aldolase
MKIDLRSDTVTKPTDAMLEAMFEAEVGDDVHGEDPSVNALEQKAADLFGHEAAVFCPSGTMTNQVGIKTHTQPGDEVICDQSAHIYNFEGGGIAFNSGASIRPVEGDRGRITPEQVQANVQGINDHFPRTRLVSIENTCNKGGGSYYTNEQMKAIHQVCQDNDLKLHLDGARLFNVLVETDTSPKTIGPWFDSISICLSKGLGAPVGSVLIGSEEFIQQARRVRKVMGGGMRQAGYLAAAGIYALDNHIDRLEEDHRHARQIGNVLEECDYVKQVLPVDTNIIVFELAEDHYTAESFLAALKEQNIKGVPFGRQLIRFVTHLDITPSMVDKTCEVLSNLK